MNTFGERFRFTTFGESHGRAIGCIVDGIPAGIYIDEEFIKSELGRRKPGQNRFATQRKESDSCEILSGVFEAKSTGTPIAMVIYNSDQKSKDYESIKDIFRPGHADFTYFHKYGLRDYRGGGRSSARESAARVACGSIAKLMLKELDIVIESGLYGVGRIESKKIDFSAAQKSEIFALDEDLEAVMKMMVDEARESHDSVGGSVLVSIKNLPIGLGEPIYYKLDGVLANAMMGINAVKGVEIGDGINSSKERGSVHNDSISESGFLSNHSGGILGGISNGEEVVVKIHFKPTPSIFKPQQTINTDGKSSICELKGRHDPCVAIRGSVVCESMAAIVIADMLLLNMSSKMENIKKLYKGDR